MRSLNATDNTDAASSDYPYRKVRDTEAGTDGTKLWERIFADTIHSIQKLIRLVGLTPNDLPDNETNGYQILDALELHGQARVFAVNWTDGGSGDIYANAVGIESLMTGKSYKFKSDKNLLPSDNIYLKVNSVDYEIEFQNCSFILADQAFNAYAVSASKVIVSPESYVNEFVGSSFSSFGLQSEIGVLGGIFKYKSRYYVTRINDDIINVYDSEGILKLSFGSTGSANGELDSPRGITVVDDKIYVCNYNNDRIEVFDLLGNFLFNFSGGNMDKPVKIIGSETTSEVYVIDSNVQDNTKSYRVSDGLFSNTFGLNESFNDMAIHNGVLYLLFYFTGVDSSVKLYDAATSASITGQGLFEFESSDNVDKLFAVNDNYMILEGANGVFIIDKNYTLYDTGNRYNDRLKILIGDYSFVDGNCDGKELYFINNDFYDGRRSIYKFL